MLYPIGTHRQLQAIKTNIPVPVFTEISEVIDRLDEFYGRERDFYAIGGYLVFAEHEEDLLRFRGEILDYIVHPCEWHYSIENSSYISVLFLLNNDFTITLITPKAITPKEIMEASK